MAMDGSNDTDLKKMNPITVKYYDVNRSKVVTGFLDMGVTTGVDAAIAETMFKAVEDCMDKNELSWNN